MLDLRHEAAGRILITGASGYLGSLIALGLLRHQTQGLVLLARSPERVPAVFEALHAEMGRRGDALTDEDRARVTVLSMPPGGGFDGLSADVERLQVSEVVHAAACLDYYDVATLEATNIDLTRRLLSACHSWGVDRFTYVSSAFCAGYREGRIEESSLREPEQDPTQYTQTKRAAEQIVAASGIPFLCIRPTVVIGDSTDGHYSGKRYGLYQLWNGIERFLCTQWEPEIHIVAPRQPTHLVHQDAFEAAFLAAWERLPPGSYFNMVSDPSVAPTARELWDIWVRECLRPTRVVYYDQIADYPRRTPSRHQRALMALGSVNLEITAHPWAWETAHMQALMRSGLHFASATLESVERCQWAFMRGSARVRAFMQERHSRAPERAGADVVGI